VRCKAKAKSTGEQCKKTAVPGMEVCRYHGGLTPRGIASPHFKHGRYSKYLPARLSQRYLEAAGDPELLALRDDIALVDARTSELLATLDSGESGRLWRDLLALRREFVEATRAGDEARGRIILADLMNAIQRGAADFERWGEVVDLLERRRRLVDSEQKRLVAMQQMVTAEQAMGLVAALAASVRGHVLERCEPELARDLLSAVQRDLDSYTCVGAGAQANP
jgi:hypothetical protein